MYYTNYKSKAAIIANMLLVLATTPAQAMDNYQYSALFTPGDYTLKAEAKGRVMIYDGLTSKTVDRAMNEQFNRIDNMMFVGIVHEQENGEYYVEDDGCD